MSTDPFQRGAVFTIEKNKQKTRLALGAPVAEVSVLLEFVGKIVIFSQGCFLVHIFCSFVSVSVDNPLPSAQQYQSGYISFSSSAPPLPRGTSASQELTSKFFLRIFLSFLFPRRASTSRTKSSSKTNHFHRPRSGIGSTSLKSSLLSSSSCSSSSSISYGISDINTS